MHRYKLVNELALSLVSSGGLMLSCSCSAAMAYPEAMLPNVVQQAALASQRHVRILKSSSTGLDHPVDIACPESSYLSALLVAVH